MLDHSEELLEPAVLDDHSATDDAAVFARSVLVLMRLNECIAADEHQLLDTAGSQTLVAFEPDFYESAENVAQMRTALLNLPNVAQDQIEFLEQELQRDVQDAQEKQEVVQALRSEFELHVDASNLRENIFRFFSTCYPDAGLRSDEVEIIVTGAMIFFCVAVFRHGIAFAPHRNRQ